MAELRSNTIQSVVSLLLRLLSSLLKPHLRLVEELVCGAKSPGGDLVTKWIWSFPLLLLIRLLVRMLLLVLQIRLGCILSGVEGAKVDVVAGWCVAVSLVPALVWMHSLEASSVFFRLDEKVLLHR